MNIKPLNDWAVIVPSEAGERTAGGIFIPDSAKEKPAEGVVEAIGPGAFEEEEKFGKKKKEKKERKFIPTTVKPGDRVLYERYAGQKITLGNVERLLVRERDILGLVTAQSSGGGRKPLQLPEKTAVSTETSLATLAMKSIVATSKGTEKQGAGSRGQGTGKAKKQGPGARGQGQGKAKKQGAGSRGQGTGKAKKAAKKKGPAKPKKIAKKAVKKTAKKKSAKKK